MICKSVRDRLNDYVDQELETVEAGIVRDHIETCPACRREHQAMLRILQEAKSLRRDEAPPRDLWPGVQDRIATRVAGPRKVGTIWVLAAAAAMLALAALFGPGLLDGRAVPQEDPVAGPVSYQEADRRFAAVRLELLEELTAGERRLAPESERILRKNLKVMDDAAAEIRKALAADPDNSGLRRMLLSSYRHQAKLLTRVREYPDAM